MYYIVERYNVVVSSHLARDHECLVVTLSVPPFAGCNISGESFDQI